MAKSFFTFSLLLLVLFNVSFAQLESMQNPWRSLQKQQQHSLRAKTDCSISRLTAQEPRLRYEYEGGETVYFDTNNQEFQCAGVEVVMNVIKPRGLFLPHYNNAPQLLYVIQGRGLQGTVFSGCPETYETELQSSRQRLSDRHQKVRQFQEGDILALPAGITLWFYNNGEVPVETISLLDVGNDANQLDQNFRNFFLAGNEQSRSSSHGRHQELRRGQQQEQGNEHNIFRGFDEELLQEVFNVDRETARSLQGHDDHRGRIVLAENFQVLSPGYEEEQERESHGGRREREEEHGGRRDREEEHGSNGLEETFCSMKLRQNIGNPARADLYNPQGGHITTANSQTLPILNYIKISAEKGTLYRNAIIAPHWNMNAHSIIYVIRGSARIQVVGNEGRSVLDEQVQQGQLVIVPQNFVVVKKAGEEGFEYIAFKTNDNAVTSPLAGRLSALRGIPVDVLVNSYQISREDAQTLKYNRDEATLLSPTRGSSRSRMEKAVDLAMKAIGSVM